MTVVRRIRHINDLLLTNTFIFQISCVATNISSLEMVNISIVANWHALVVVNCIMHTGHVPNIYENYLYGIGSANQGKGIQ